MTCENKKIRRITKVRYIGKSSDALNCGTEYLCVAQIVEGPQKGYLSVINNNGEDYVYAPENFEVV